MFPYHINLVVFDKERVWKGYHWRYALKGIYPTMIGLPNNDAFLYHAFISYSHDTDLDFAPILQQSVQRFGKRWYQRKKRTLFRDATNLSPDVLNGRSPEETTERIEKALEEALDKSKYFILLASPTAAQSDWVALEIKSWVQQHGSERLLIVLTDGEIQWDYKENDFDWQKTTALPEVLRGWWRREPLWLDVRDLKSEADT